MAEELAEFLLKKRDQGQLYALGDENFGKNRNYFRETSDRYSGKKGKIRMYYNKKHKLRRRDQKEIKKFYDK